MGEEPRGYVLTGTPRRVYVWSNGMAMVFDARGNQISDLQWRWAEVREKILAARDERTTIEGAHWPSNSSSSAALLPDGGGE